MQIKGNVRICPECKSLLKLNSEIKEWECREPRCRLVKKKPAKPPIHDISRKKGIEKPPSEKYKRLLSNIKKGLPIAKKTDLPKTLLPEVLKIYMWDDDKVARAMARSVFFKNADTNLQLKVKDNWKASYRNLTFSGDIDCKLVEVIDCFLEAFKEQIEFHEVALHPFIKALKDEDWEIGEAAGLTLSRMAWWNPPNEPLLNELTTGHWRAVQTSWETIKETDWAACYQISSDLYIIRPRE